MKPKLPTFNIAKLVYLFDLACVQILGSKATKFPYKWHLHGPYCKEIEDAIWELKDEKKIDIIPYTTKKNYDCQLHVPVEEYSPEIGKPENEILKYIMKNYKSLNYEELKDFVYNTPPMQEAKKKNKRFEPLNLKVKSDIPKHLLNKETLNMILNSEISIREKRLIPFEKAWEKLESKCS